MAFISTIRCRSTIEERVGLWSSAGPSGRFGVVG